MVERVVIEDVMSDGTATEAVAISAESLPQTFILEPIKKWFAGIISLKQALMMPAASPRWVGHQHFACRKKPN